MTCVCLRRSHREARRELDSCLEITKLRRGAESHRGGVWCPVTQPAQGEASSWDQLRFSSSFSSRCSMPPSLFLLPLFLDRSTYGPFPPCRLTSYSGLFPEWLRCSWWPLATRIRHLRFHSPASDCASHLFC